MTKHLYKADPREIPTYSLGEASRHLFIPETTLKGWVYGRTIGRKFNPPLIAAPGGTREPRLLSFVNLVEAHILKAIRVKHGVRMWRIRRAVDTLKRVSKSSHPLADLRLKTDNVDLFVEEYGSLINLSRGGQLGIKEILNAFLERIELDPKGVATRLYPVIRPQVFNSPKIVVIDPFVSFGKPIITGTGIRTAIIADRHFAGDSIDLLADDYNLDSTKIEEAIRYESSRQAA
jgi:uncharacterized protein (DUF433 family)